MDAKLVLVREGFKPTVVRLKKLPMTVGRGREADLTIAHPMVSRLHCELYEVEGTLCVRDMGSLNGTFVGESQIDEAALESGDQLIVGSAKFQVVIDEEVDAGKEIEAPAVTADDETGDQGGSIIEATEFDDLQEGEFEEIKEFDEALAETDEGVEQPAAKSEFDFEDQVDDEVIVKEDTEDVDQIIVPESAEADEEPTEEAAQLAASEDAEAPAEEDQPEAEEEEEEVMSFFPPQDEEIDEQAEKPAAASGKIDLGLAGDDAPAKIDSDDDDLQDFLAGFK